VIGALEALERLVERRSAHQGVKTARLVVHPNAVPPEIAKLLHEAPERYPPLEQVGKAALVAVKPSLDRNVGERRVLAQETTDDVSSASAGAADEDERALWIICVM